MLTNSKVFIDCGGNDGCSIRKFSTLFQDSSEYVIHSFEPNPFFAEYYRYLQNVTLHQDAVWVQDGAALFYLSKSDRYQGSTLIRSKHTGNLDLSSPIVVNCIDFSSWLRNTFNADDLILLKMDIEGAEYDVLEKMIRDDTVRYISKLYIEFHYEKIGLSKRIHDDLIDKLARHSLPIENWDALDF